VEDHAETIKTVGLDGVRAVVCDHDAEDRATLARKLGCPTLAAYKAVAPGIQATAARLKPAGDGRSRLMLMADSLVEKDPELADAGKPTCTEDEVESYVWDTRAGLRKGDQPVKRDDHGMDATRYIVAFVDDLALDPERPEGTEVFYDPVEISRY